jgi:hypothetical protein
MGEFSGFLLFGFVKVLNISFSVPTNVHVFPGVPHGFRRYKTLPDSKRWDEVMSDGIAWALTNPSPGPFEIKSK